MAMLFVFGFDVPRKEGGICVRIGSLKHFYIG